MAVQASGRIVFHQIADGSTVSFTLVSSASTTQSRYRDNGKYYPDYKTTPLKLKPILTGVGTGNTNLVIGTCRWYLDGSPITSEQNGFTIATSGDYALTIGNNFSTTGHVIACEYDYKPDAVHQTVRLRTERSFNLNEVAGAAITADIKYISGGTHFSTRAGGSTVLEFEGVMVRGGVEDITDVENHWYITGTDGRFYEITGTAAPSGSGLPSGKLFELGANEKSIKVYSTAVLNVANLKLVVKDTDANSGTTGMTAEHVIGLVDETDPFVMEMNYSKGNGMNTSVTTGNYPVVISIRQGKDLWADGDYTNKTLSFYRETAASGKDATFVPATGDFSGWTIDNTNHEVKRTFNASAGLGTEANRTVVFTPAHMIKTQAETAFIVSLIF